MMGFRDPNADETYWAEYWDEFLQDNGIAEYVKARYQDGGNLRNCYDSTESWRASVDSLTEADACGDFFTGARDSNC